MIKKCYCGKEYITYPSKILLGRGKYCSKKCFDKYQVGKSWSLKTQWKKGTMPWSFKGWRYQQSRSSSGKYILLYKPDYPGADVRGYIREHRYIMEVKLGRRLNKEEIVHHIDGNSLNNNPENLQVMLKRDHDRMNTPLNVHKRWIEKGGVLIGSR